MTRERRLLPLPALILMTAALAIADPAAGAAFPEPASGGFQTLAAGLASGVAGAGSDSGERLARPDELRRFYAARQLQPAWSANRALSSNVDTLLAALRGADREGLRVDDYHRAAIEAELARLPPGAADAGDRGASSVAAGFETLDLLLSDAFFLYASHLTAGRLQPESVEPAWNIAGRDRDLVLLLQTALERDHLAATLRELPPAREDYRLLKAALETQRAIAARGGWPLMPWGPTLRAGDRGPRVVALRRRLAATGELPDTAGAGVEPELFDVALADALRRFQARHGLDADAVAGKRTLSELNAPASLRARQIEANLERLRWLPRAFPARRLLVNVADFRLELTEPGVPDLSLRVIAGRQARRTPFFTGEIKSILFNPTWTVPEKIAVEDKLPLIQRDRGFLAEQGFRVYEYAGGESWREIDPGAVDWARLSKNRFPYQLRQDAGPKNALGSVKFQIPNQHDIYLHDTPSRGLFARAERSFSSGCIRVERAVDLAERLLAADPQWPRSRIDAVIAAGETVRAHLSESLPVYLLYWTAWVDRDGSLQFREDVYGRDEAVCDALARPL